MGNYLQPERYAQIGGGRVCYIDEGSGPALLFVHGIGASMTNWAPNIEYFKRRYRVIALDLPGFGKSDFADNDCTVEQFCGAILGLLEHLGVENVSVIGNSLGGLIALHMTLEHPELVLSLVLVDSAGAHAFPFLLKAALRKLPAGWIKPAILFLISRLPKYGWAHRLAGFEVRNEHTGAMVDEALALRDRPDLDSYLETYLRTARTALFTRLDERLGEIEKPVLLVWGRNDVGVPLKVGQRMNTLIRDSYLVVIQDAAHVPMLDQPEEFNTVVERFLAGARAMCGGGC